MHILINDETFQNFSDEEILWECLTFLFAGAATVGATMMNVLYYSSLNENITTKIREELAKVCEVNPD